MAFDEAAIPTVGVTTPSRNREGLPMEDTKLLQALCKVIRKVDFKQSSEDPWATTISTLNTTDPDISRGYSVDKNEGEPVKMWHANAGRSQSDLNVRPKTTDGGERARLDSTASGREALHVDAEPDTGKNTYELENENNKSVTAQMSMAVDADANVTSRYHRLIDLLTPVLGAGDVRESEGNRRDEHITCMLYKRFKDVNDKLHLLENAISRLGGIHDVLRGIQQLRGALELALRGNAYRFSPESFVRRYFFRHGVLDLTKVLTYFRSDLKEDGVVFGERLSHVDFLVKLISESAKVLHDALHELGTVNGCQFVTLCSSLRAVRNNTQSIVKDIMRKHVSLLRPRVIKFSNQGYKSAEGRAKELVMNHLFEALIRDTRR